MSIFLDMEIMCQAMKNRHCKHEREYEHRQGDTVNWYCMDCNEWLRDKDYS